MSSGEGLLRNAARALERVNEEGGSGSGTSTPDAAGGSGAGGAAGGGVVRPLEDPYLVGEVAAARARRERLARENGVDVLQREDRRWDWFLGKCFCAFDIYFGNTTPPPPPPPRPLPSTESNKDLEQKLG